MWILFFQETPRHLLHHQPRAGKGQVDNKKHFAHKFPNVEKKPYLCVFSRYFLDSATRVHYFYEEGSLVRRVPIEQFVLIFSMSTPKKAIRKDNAIKNKSFCTKIQRCFSTHWGTSTKEKNLSHSSVSSPFAARCMQYFQSLPKSTFRFTFAGRVHWGVRSPARGVRPQGRAHDARGHTRVQGGEGGTVRA